MMSKEEMVRQEKFRRKHKRFFEKNGAETIAPATNERLRAQKKGKKR